MKLMVQNCVQAMDLIVYIINNFGIINQHLPNWKLWIIHTSC